MRVKYMKYGKRMLGPDGQSEYFEASVEVGPMDNPEDCAYRAKKFVQEQLIQAQDNHGSTIGDHLAAKSKQG